jgi:hypothetical protein
MSTVWAYFSKMNEAGSSSTKKYSSRIKIRVLFATKGETSGKPLSRERSECRQIADFIQLTYS